jgi:hypothetical protein
MGLRMFEDIARDIETAAKGLPKDFTYRRMAKAVAPSDLKMDAGSRTDVSTITTDAKDRDGEVVIPAGGSWQDYNNVVTFCHQYDQLPLGSCLWMKATPNAIVACTQYPTKPEDWGDAPWLPSAVLHLMQQPVPTCTGKSIGFLPKNIRTATPAEIEIHPDWKSAPIIDQWHGFEYAGCPIGANQEALMMSVSKEFAPMADMFRKAIEAYTPCIQAAKNARRTIIVVPPNYRSTKMADMPPVSSPGPQTYQHLDFQPPKEVVACHKDGMARCEAGECKTHVTPEMKALCMHLAMGGEASPGMCKTCKAFHDAAPNHVGAKPGTPAYALAQMHGGAAGKAYYETMCKAMDLADSAPGPGPATAIDENGGQPAPMLKKDMGAGENVGADGGMAVPLSMPMCKACGHNNSVEVMKGEDGKPVMMKDADKPPEMMKTDGTMHPAMMFTCKMCGKDWGEPAMVKPDGTVTTNSDAIPPLGAGGGADLPGGMSAAEKAAALKAAKSIGLNTAVSHIKSKVSSGDVSDEDWEKPNDTELDPMMCLGVDASQPKENAGRWAYPVGKGGKIYRKAVANAEARASAQGASAIAGAAKAIMEMMQKRDEDKKDADAEALAAKMVELQTDEIVEEAMREVEDRLIMDMGGV